MAVRQRQHERVRVIDLHGADCITPTCDALIVGAGPAGSAAALLLARAGVDVILVDRGRAPRPKPCGECLSPHATRLLAELGVLPAIRAEGPARIAGWRITSPAGTTFEQRFDAAPGADAATGVGLAIDRAVLDAALLAAARSAGARCIERFTVTRVRREQGRVCGVEGRTGDGALRRVSARFVIGADGLRSRVAADVCGRSRPPRVHKLSLTAHVRGFDPGHDLGELHIADGACLGVAPISAEPGALANVTVVLDAGRGRQLARGTRSDRFSAALARFPVARRRLAAAELVGPGPARQPWLASGPFDRAMRSLAVPGCALVGDAAGYYDPFTGQGICHALADAIALAGVLPAVLEDGPRGELALRRFARAQRRRMREAHTLQRAIAAITARPRLADAGVAALATSPALGAALLAATGDLVPPRALLSPRLLLTFVEESLARRRA